MLLGLLVLLLQLQVQSLLLLVLLQVQSLLVLLVSQQRLPLPLQAQRLLVFQLPLPPLPKREGQQLGWRLHSLPLALAALLAGQRRRRGDILQQQEAAPAGARLHEAPLAGLQRLALLGGQAALLLAGHLPPPRAAPVLAAQVVAGAAHTRHPRQHGQPRR